MHVSDPSDAVIESQVHFRALDGFDLAGTLYEPTSKVAAERAAVLNCGGGVRAAHYRRFARYLAEGGVPVLTYDYRGIGQSRPMRLRGFAASIEDWAEYDCGGAIAWMRRRYPDAALVGIAHSIGALLLGGAPNANELSRFVLVCSHTGYFGDYRRLYRVPMAVLWHGVMPALTRLFGYFPARRLGLGDDIPFGVALQWAARRSHDLKFSGPGDATRAKAGLARCRGLRAQALIVSVTDDAFATEAGTRRLLSYLPGLKPRELRVSPADVGARGVGHFGFFRRSARATVWPRVLAYILQATPRQAESLSTAVLP